MGFSRRSVVASVALSGVLHAIVIATAPRRAVQTPARRMPSTIELSIEARGDARAEPAPGVPSEPVSARPSPARSRAKKVSSALPKRETEEPPAAALPTTPQAFNATVKPLDLVPKASALLPFACGLLGDRPTSACDAASDLPAVGAAERALNERLSAAANQPAYRDRRAPPKLVPAADGGYDYTDRARAGETLIFRAHIAADGAVQFEDGANVQLSKIPISGSFEVDDAVRRGELHTAEKRWFLEQTAELRARLASAARTTEDLRVRRMIESALERIRASAATSSAKHEAVFELWSGCGDVAKTRAMVEAWVREHMPEGTELAFSLEELRRLNRALPSASRFDPYASR